MRANRDLHPRDIDRGRVAPTHGGTLAGVEGHQRPHGRLFDEIGFGAAIERRHEIGQVMGADASAAR
jgi:hypothetical protein